MIGFLTVHGLPGSGRAPHERPCSARPQRRAAPSSRLPQRPRRDSSCARCSPLQEAHRRPGASSLDLRPARRPAAARRRAPRSFAGRLHVAPGEASSARAGRGRRSPASFSVLQLLPPPLEILGGSVSFEGEDLRSVPARRLRGDPRWRGCDGLPGSDELAEPARRHEIVETLRATGPSASRRRRARATVGHVGFRTPSGWRMRSHTSSRGGISGSRCGALDVAARARGREPTTALDVTDPAADPRARREPAGRDGDGESVGVTHAPRSRRAPRNLSSRTPCRTSSSRRRPATSFVRPQHPYTPALLGSFPGPRPHRTPATGSADAARPCPDSASAAHALPLRLGRRACPPGAAASRSRGSRPGGRGRSPRRG